MFLCVDIEPASLQGLKRESSNKIGSRNHHQLPSVKRLNTDLLVPYIRKIQLVPLQYQNLSILKHFFRDILFNQNVNDLTLSVTRTMLLVCCFLGYDIDFRN